MIRDNLQRLETADERALFAVQLDNRSIFLDRWREVFLRVLSADAAATSPLRVTARQLVESRRELEVDMEADLRSLLGEERERLVERRELRRDRPQLVERP